MKNLTFACTVSVTCVCIFVARSPVTQQSRVVSGSIDVSLTVRELDAACMYNEGWCFSGSSRGVGAGGEMGARGWGAEVVGRC